MATSTITGVITNPAGTALANVAVKAILRPRPAFVTATGAELAVTYETTTDSNGQYVFTLTRTADITPSGSWYEITEQISPRYGGAVKHTVQVGASNQTVYAALISTPPVPGTSVYLTQASADARYVQSPGSFSAVGNIADSRPADAASAGALSTYARGDHKHSREIVRSTAAAIAALTGVDLITGHPYVTSDAANLTGTGIATPDTASQPARTDGLWVKNAQRFQMGHWNQPWGIMGYVARITDVTGITSQADITGTDLTFTAAANRRYKLTGYCRTNQITTTSNQEVYITTSGNTVLQTSAVYATAAQQQAHHLVVVVTPAAGSITYKMRAAVSAGSVDIKGATTYPIIFFIEDIGPNGAPA